VMTNDDLVEHSRRMRTHCENVVVASVAGHCNDAYLVFGSGLLHEPAKLQETVRIVGVVHHHREIVEAENVESSRCHFRSGDEGFKRLSNLFNGETMYDCRKNRGENILD